MQIRLTKAMLLFFTCAVLGWCYEVFLEVVVYGWGFSNRGFLFGPYCPVYGFGALLLWRLLEPVRRNRRPLAPLFVFLGTMALTTALELAASYFLEALTGQWLWDYTRYTIQFDGRIALNPSMRFGLGGLLLLYGLLPALERAWAALGAARCRRLALCAAGLLTADFLATLCLRIL